MHGTQLHAFMLKLRRCARVNTGHFLEWDIGVPEVDSCMRSTNANESEQHSKPFSDF